MQTLYPPHVLAALSIKRARSAEYLALPPTQRDAHNQVLMRDEETRHLHRVRARAAYMKAKPAPTPRRRLREAPKPSRQYADITTEAARDPRLGSTAVKLLTIITAQSGSTGYTDSANGSLAGVLKMCKATVKRHIADLERFGYLRREMRYNELGMMTCRRLTPTDKVWPDWHRFHSKSRESAKLRRALPKTQKDKKEDKAPDISAKDGEKGQPRPKAAPRRRRNVDPEPNR
jgi:hypothetical protein